MNRTLKLAICSLTVNTAFSASYFLLGVLTDSWWLLTLGTYYLILSIVRFFVIRGRNKIWLATRFAGIMLTVLSVPLAGTVILSVVRDRGHELHMIVMITMALYAFTKITLATVNLVKARKSKSDTMVTLRNISFADAFVSIFALQRSMLVSFDGMSEAEIQIMNAVLGTVVCVIVFLLGLNLIGGKYTDNAKSKIAKSNEKNAKTVTRGYKMIENGVVKGYKAIEKGIVKCYTKIEDKFVNAFLKKDGETVEEAKERLKQNKK